MANFKKITVLGKTTGTITASVEVQIRRYRNKGHRYSVICRNGWPMDRPDIVRHWIGKAEAVQVLRNYLNYKAS